MRRLVVLTVVAVVIAVVTFVYLKRGEKPDDQPDEVAQKTEVRKPKPRQRSGARDRGMPERAVLMDDDPVGTLRLEGQVLDSEERPVAGAEITLGSVPPRKTKSGEDGAFAFDKLVARRYRLAARSAAGVAGPLSTRLTASSDPVILKLSAASSAQITVRQGKQRRVASQVRVELRGLSTLVENTGADGVVTFTGVVPGRYEAIASKVGFAPQRAWLRVPGDGALAKAELVLRAGAGVQGQVVDEAGKPIRGARVIYAGASEWAQSADARLDAVTSNDAGEFSFPALPRGSFRFEARHRGFAPGSSELVTLDGVTETTGVKIRLTMGAKLTGVVVSKAGEPQASARVRVGVKTDSWSWDRPRQAYTDDNGAFSIDSLPRQPLEVVAVHESAASELTVIDFSKPPYEREVQITLGITDSIAGIVVDDKGEPIEGARVWAWPDMTRGARVDRSRWRLRGRSTELSDAGGRFRLRGLKPGPYQVRASRPHSMPRAGWRREPVTADAGDTDVRIVMEPEGGVKGKVAFADGKAPTAFTISTGGWGRGQPFANKAGEFEVVNLPPRDYVLIVRGAGFDAKQVKVTVKSGAVEDLGTITVRQGRKVAGRVVANGKPIPGALVMAGHDLSGDGTSIDAPAGGPGARTAKRATTDEEGEFVIFGVATGDLVVVAEHPDHGRVQAIYIPASTKSTLGVVFELQEYGALEGTVTKNGTVQANSIVTAHSPRAPSANFSVSSGDDGKYRFDRLAPGEYQIQAMVGTPMSGMGFYPVTGEVKSNETTTADLDIKTGSIQLAVTSRPKSGQIGLTMVHAARAQLNTKTMRELTGALAQLDSGVHTFGFSIGTNPAPVKDLEPGAYTVCAVPYPTQVRGMGQIFSYREREGDNLITYCKQITVTSGQTEYAVEIPVEVPRYIPPPDDKQGTSGDSPAP